MFLRVVFGRFHEALVVFLELSCDVCSQWMVTLGCLDQT